MKSNKDIRNIKNNMRIIDKELAKQGSKINEHMKSFEKTYVLLRSCGELQATLQTTNVRGSFLV